MTLGCIRLSETNANLLRQHPKLIHHFLDGAETGPPPVGGFCSRLFGGKGEPPAPLPALEPREDGDEECADQTWQAIHYLLTGSAVEGGFPSGLIFHGGSEVGDEDVGYDPGRIFKHAEVVQIDTVLQRETRETLYSRHDGERMDVADVYPHIWARDGQDGFEYVWQNFLVMQTFVHETARKRQCLLLFLC